LKRKGILEVIKNQPAASVLIDIIFLFPLLAWFALTCGFQTERMQEKIKKPLEKIRAPRIFVHLFRWSILKQILIKEELHQ